MILEKSLSFPPEAKRHWQLQEAGMGKGWEVGKRHCIQINTESRGELSCLAILMCIYMINGVKVQMNKSSVNTCLD